MVVLGGGAASYERGSPVVTLKGVLACCWPVQGHEFSLWRGELSFDTPVLTHTTLNCRGTSLIRITPPPRSTI